MGVIDKLKYFFEKIFIIFVLKLLISARVFYKSDICIFAVIVKEHENFY